MVNTFRYINSYAVIVPSFYSLWGYVLASDFDININYDYFQNVILKRIKKRKLQLNGIGEEEFFGLFLIPKIIKKSYE